MAIFNVRRTGFGTAAETVIKLIEDLTANGMRLVYPNNAFGPVAPTSLANIHPDTGYMMTTNKINFDGDPYFPVARFILESTSSIDVKTTLASTVVNISFTGTVASNIDGTSTLTVTVPPSVGAIKIGMTINLPGASTTTTTTTAAPGGTTTTTAAPASITPYSGQIISGSGTTWKVTAMQPAVSPVTITGTDNFTSLSDSTVLTEGWRICFDFPLQFIEDYALTTINPTTKVRTGGLTTKAAGSTVFEDFMAVYVGSSVQLRNDGQVSILPDVRTIGNAVKVGYVQPDGLIGSPYRYSGFNSVSAKSIALVPPIAVVKAWISTPPATLNLVKRLGGMITANMVFSGGETGTVGDSIGKNLRILPFTYINMDPQTNTSVLYDGTGLGDTGTYAIAATAGYTQYPSQAAQFIPPEDNPIKAVGVSAEINGADVGFINRINLDRLSGLAVPVSYELTITKKGIFIGVWDILSEQSGRRFNWLLVQRSVDRVSGAIRGRTKTTETGAVATFLESTTSSVCPVYCVNCVNNLYYQFTVRETDQGGPSIPRSASMNSEDNTAIINPFDQQSITDEGKYVITFLNKLNTTRHRYADELDMIGTVSSDVIGFGTDVRISAYGEELGTPSLQRVYRSLPSNNPYGTGMRLMILTGWETTEDGVGAPGTLYPAGPANETPPA